MNTAKKLIHEPPRYDNVIPLFPDRVPKRRTTDSYKSNGMPKATAADPIRNPEHIKAMRQYYIDHGQIRNHAMFTLGIMFGIRAGDLCELRIDQVANSDGSIKPRCRLYEQKTRKTNSPMITPATRDTLRRYLDDLGDYGIHDYLFRSRQRDNHGNYRHITIQQLNNVIKKAARDVGIQDHISSHSLRKTFAYQLLRQHPNDDEVKFALQRMLNHNDFKTTLAYCGIEQEAMDEYRIGLEALVI